MKRTFNCLTCKKKITVNEIKSEIGRAKYCSKSCKYKGHGNNFFWPIATEEKKIEHMKVQYESKVIRSENGCWGWKGYLHSGYGEVRNNKNYIKAHRFSWEMNFGKIPEGKYVLHSCDNRSCSNPSHLFLGTHKDNMVDMLSKGRQKGAIGSKNIKAKLSEENVLEIRRLIQEKVIISEIAKSFSVTKGSIYKIKSGTYWKHI